MICRRLTMLLCASALLAADPDQDARTLLSASAQIAPASVKGGGMRMTRAEVEQMIQDREDRLMPTSKRRDFRLNPEGVQGWAFRRRALLDMLYAMKDQSDDAPVYIVLGHTPNVDAAGNPIQGTWHETVILCESRPFYLPVGGAFSIQTAGPDDSYFLQHPNTWP